MIEMFVRLFVFGYFLTMPLIALAVSTVKVLRLPRPRDRARMVEICTRQFMFWVVGMAFAFNFVFHTFLGQLSASLIGWQDSPFQPEVGYASLGYALLGFYAAFSTFSVRLGAVLALTPFMWGAAVGHVIDLVQNGNVSVGNAGFILWLDFLLPAVGIVLLILSRRHPVRAAVGPVVESATVEPAAAR
jgi:hypothetical protein